MDDVGAPKLFEQERPVGELRHQSAYVIDAECVAQRSRRDGIDGDEPRFDVRIFLPRVQQTCRLYRLSAKNAERWSNEGDSESMHGTDGRWRAIDLAALQMTRREHDRPPSAKDAHSCAVEPSRHCSCNIVFRNTTVQYPYTSFRISELCRLMCNFYERLSYKFVAG